MKSYDVIVVGAGSGNMLLGPELAHLRAAIIEPDYFGGTCLNRGCIPRRCWSWPPTPRESFTATAAGASG